MQIHERRTRADRTRANLVNTGIAMLEDANRAAVAAYLERERVPFAVIVRVLSEPGRRRPPTSPR